jgi:uncharacterized protein (TIGR02453 family)
MPSTVRIRPRGEENSSGREAAMAFRGIPAEAFDFYDALAADNSRAFWTDHRHEYEAAVREPLQLLGEALGPRFGTPHLYRPYRDLRFSKDKRPIKDHQGLYVEMRNGLGWYVQVSAAGLMVAGGWYTGTPAQLSRYREAVGRDESGTLAALVAGVERAGFTVGGDVMKTRPRGVPQDHPRLALLRHRTLYAWRTTEPAAWMGTRRAAGHVEHAWDSLTPLMDWLADHVGPGEPSPRTR